MTGSWLPARSLGDFGVRFPRQALATSPGAAVRVAREFGDVAVALKIASPDILHKSDVGGVLLGLRGDGQIEEGFKRIRRNVGRSAPSARVEGLIVQEMVRPGVEAIIGLTNDPAFGPVIMFGVGGVFTEVVRDVAFATLPLSRDDAWTMIRSLRSRRVLEDYRGHPRVDQEMLASLLTTVAEFGHEVADHLGSVDLNPVVLWDDDYRVVDAKVLLEKKAAPLSVELPNPSDLSTFFEARSVAVVGASPTVGKIGYFVLDSLAGHEYRGKVYPVNPHRDEILGLKAWPSIASIPGEVELAVVATPLDDVPALVQQCASKGCRNMVIVSGGGKEVGSERARLEEAIRTLSRSAGVRIVGCNCIGVFDGESRLDTFFQTHERMVRPVSGRAAMITQSGTVGAMFLEEMAYLGVSRFVSFGNRIDVDESDLLVYLNQDPRTRVIAVYCEGFRSGLKFARTASAVTPSKPVVVFKAARGTEAAAAAVSHTGFYGGSYEVALGAFRQCGVIAVDSTEELTAATKALACLEPARGNRVAMISNGAGTTVQAVDLLAGYGLNLARISDGTSQRLRGEYPAFYQVSSLVDVTGSASVRDYVVGIEALLADPGVDIIMPWFVLQDTPLEESVAGALSDLVREAPKPVVCGAAGGSYTRKIREEFERHGVPLLGSVREWVAAAMSLAERGRQIRSWEGL